MDLHSYLTTLSLPLLNDDEELYEWIAASGDSPVRFFRSSYTWEVLRPRQQEVDWDDIVWFKGTVPKQAFTMWVANYDRLPARSRLAAWGLQVSTDCPFFSRSIETRDHLFLRCEYNLQVWREVFIRCSVPSSNLMEWSELLSWIRAAASTNLKLLRKLATHRNNLIHNQTSLPAALVFYGIDKELKNIISSRRHSKHFCSLMALWLS